MSSIRNYTIVRTAKTREDCESSMACPWWILNEPSEGQHYSLDEIRLPILVETEMPLADVGDFPKNIQEYFWAEPGERDGDYWLSCGQLTNGAFFFFKGSCDRVGFESQGGMSLWVSNTWENIVDYAFTEEDYELYIYMHENNEWQNYPICAHCDDEAATMPNDWNDDGDLCADCYWDLDSAKKRERRQDPEWRYSRAYSAAKVILGKSHEEALVIAASAIKNI